MTAIWSLLAFLVAVGLLVSFHEYGHYLAARMTGVRVGRFSVGFGKVLFSYQKNPSSTQWALSALPLGGYVKLDEESFKEKALWRRSLIVAAGPLANFILAIALFVVLFSSGVTQVPARLSEPVKESLAYQVGIYQGDEVVGFREENAAGFQEIKSWNQLRWRLLDSITDKEGFVLQVKTSEGRMEEVHFKTAQLPPLSPDIDPISGLGIQIQVPDTSDLFELRFGLAESIQLATQRVWDISIISVRMLAGIFTGESSVKQIGGPISIAEMAGKTAQTSIQSYLGFLALISISLGILNLIPLPMLDGGQLMYDAWELLTGKRIPEAVQAIFQRIGMASIMFLTLLAVFNDITRLFLR